MHIYVLAKNYGDWVTTEHTFGRPEGKWWSWSERMRQLSSAYDCILWFPKARRRGLAQVCRVGVWRCKKALNNLGVLLLPGCSNKVNITGTSFQSFLRPLCWMMCHALSLVCSSEFVSVSSSVTDRIVTLVWPNNFIKLKWQNEACGWRGGCMRCWCSLWLLGMCVLFPCMNLCTEIYTISQVSMPIYKCEYSVWLHQRAEYILHVMSKVNSHTLLTLIQFFLRSHRFLFDISFKFEHCSVCLLCKIKIWNWMGFLLVGRVVAERHEVWS